VIARLLLVLFVETLMAIGFCVVAAAAWSTAVRATRRLVTRRRIRRGEWPYR
jgi:hypothetical protein